MGVWAFFSFMVTCLFVLFQTNTCMALSIAIGRLKPGFQVAQLQFIDDGGTFLCSNNSIFCLGFITSDKDYTTFVLGIFHLSTSRKIWSANRATPVRNSDKFVFEDGGNAILQIGGSVIWSTNTSNKGVYAMEMQDSGNLILLGKDSKIVWQSFDHPTDTLLSNQKFSEGMKLVSNPSTSNLTFFLEMKSGDMVLYANFGNPQPYWSIRQDDRKIIQKNGQNVSAAYLIGNSWRFYDKSRIVFWQLIISGESDTNSTLVATLGDDGYITFFNLESQNFDDGFSVLKIPANSCSRPESCNPYKICYHGNINDICGCLSVLNSTDNCRPGIVSPCKESHGSTELIDAGNGLSYFALGLVAPSSKTSLDGCKTSCLANCSCLAMFFEEKSQNCFHFDNVGSLKASGDGSDFVSYIKVSRNGGNLRGHRGSKKKILLVAIILTVTTLIIGVVLYGIRHYYQKQNSIQVESPRETEEKNFLENISGMPIRFSHYDLQVATNNFSRKLGQGGFGSVYEGVLSDGTRVAVKQLEGIGQGKKEFRAEVSSIGSIHHHHLVRLKGFCAEDSHRLLVYEYMANGSLEKWIFSKHNGDVLDWDTRFAIAIGTARGLAYLHENCEVKIVHCDIKPENVLLDENFHAKVADFGLAKLMSREQSHVFTTLRGTRGYLAPEWITNSAISEKSDVYSYGMLLLEIIGGRRNYYASETDEQCNFPSYAFEMMEQGKVRDIVDAKLRITLDDERVSIAIKVALWCIQHNMHLRPSMTKVVKMLEQVSFVPPPPSSQQMNSSEPLDLNSCADLSAVRLSGPR
ncbi:hypothetical protein DCAR_0310170 [Daucus carota subsp. sativus]|uniref:Receptor-like serine/threonine-protein kinase n=1 Tax=Daucus carota subsp. sativus TaxID=79200 RepID=A0AAF0WME7_DAUCS|nr:PREDICTED: G-type lectin S-receptor-like serine/threonine-protein kinase SD2-5 [Daucus carota subsp. sativus]WOG90923.1 hypothetical protein DCAR_0310170 [Daucus carota subsp. sativus]